MGYTIHLFALDADRFADQLRDGAEQLLEGTRARLEREQRLEPKELERGLRLAAQLCRGEMPPICDDDYFWALCWLADTALERIPLETLVSLKRFSFVEEAGIWQPLEKWPPPFPVPRAERIPPGVGYLPRNEIATFAIPFLAALPQPRDEDVRYARQVFLEVLESLTEDALDLLAIAT